MEKNEAIKWIANKLRHSTQSKKTLKKSAKKMKMAKIKNSQSGGEN